MKLVVLPQLGFTSFMMALVTAMHSCPVLLIEVLLCFLAVWHQKGTCLTDRHTPTYARMLVQLDHTPRVFALCKTDWE